MGTKFGGWGVDMVQSVILTETKVLKQILGPGLITPVNSQIRQCHWKTPTHRGPEASFWTHPPIP